MWKLHEKIRKVRKRSLKSRLLFRVLAPPFVLLLVLSIAGFWQLDSIAQNSAIDTLRRAAVTTAAKLDREFALRQTVLRSTGEELFTIKKEYNDKRSTLESTRAKSTSAEYAKQTAALDADEQKAIRDRLDTFVEYFPETVVLITINDSSTPVSQALSKQISDETGITLTHLASKALKSPIEGYYVEGPSQRQLVFAYPIKGGAVLAAYNLDHANFLRPSWQDTPIDQSKNYALIASSTYSASYPKTDRPNMYQKALHLQDASGTASFVDGGVDYLAVAEPIGKSNWSVVVGSPSIIALDSLINTQIIAVIIIGLLLVSFLWVGAVFVNRTIRSILVLSGGAHVFSSGDLVHRIDPSAMDDEEFAHLATTLNDMAGRIQESEKAIDQKNKEFINVATHEIKAPISAIIGNLSMLLDDGMGEVDDTARTLSTEAYRSTIRLRDLVNELLDIARLESGRSKFTIEDIDLHAEIIDMIKLQQVTADKQGIHVTSKLPDDLPHVLADKTKLEIILTNFISNAIKYNRPDGTVTITAKQQDKLVQISITDTGLGIPDAQKAQMFQKFFRVDSDDRRGIPGTGLGMYITKQFIEAMGGTLWFESTHGKGTTFHFTLVVTADRQVSE